MLLAHHPAALASLRIPTSDKPLRILVSGCLAGWQCGVDGSDNGLGQSLGSWLGQNHAQLFPFCPEQLTLGTPRSTPDIHGGDGVDVISGRAQVLDENGVELTKAMLEGAAAMLEFARKVDVELAILTDMSAACGTQVISDGARSDSTRRYRLGVGVAAAMLIDDGFPVVSQRDYWTLARLRAHLDPGFVPDPAARYHHRHLWVLQHLPGKHPRAGRKNGR